METARVTWVDDCQVVYLPEGFRIDGDTVHVMRRGDAILLLPCGKSWQPLLDACGTVSDDFADAREQPEQQERPGADDGLPAGEPPLH